MEGGFGLYIHWPFCQAKCPYCDFNSHVSDQIEMDRWAKAYVAELERARHETGPEVLETVFFGGGTPSLMSPDLVSEVLDQVRRLWPMRNAPEITMEANPTSVEAEKFAAFRQAGVNRLSMGVQALNDVDLKRLGRLHSAREAIEAFDIARDAFDRVSFDLIYARQDQSLSEWKAELSQALCYAVDHLSLYQLTIEPGTAFGMRFEKGKLPGLPSEDLGADMYEATQEIMEAQGMPAYEISNHARPGAESAHNLIYWRGGSYVGIGPGAHGRLNVQGQRIATETYLDPLAWLQAVEKKGSGESKRESLSGADQANEYLLMSLRLQEGTNLSRFGRLGGTLQTERMDALIEQGFLEHQDNILTATREGRPLLNALLRELMVA